MGPASNSEDGLNMDRTRVTVVRMVGPQDHGCVPGTPAERIALVWPLTRETASLAGYDVDAPMQRDVVRVVHRGCVDIEGPPPEPAGR